MRQALNPANGSEAAGGMAVGMAVERRAD